MHRERHNSSYNLFSHLFSPLRKRVSYAHNNNKQYSITMGRQKRAPLHFFFLRNVTLCSYYFVLKQRKDLLAAKEKNMLIQYAEFDSSLTLCRDMSGGSYRWGASMKIPLLLSSLYLSNDGEDGLGIVFIIYIFFFSFSFVDLFFVQQDYLFFCLKKTVDERFSFFHF